MWEVYYQHQGNVRTFRREIKHCSIYRQMFVTNVEMLTMWKCYLDMKLGIELYGNIWKSILFLSQT